MIAMKNMMVDGNPVLTVFFSRKVMNRLRCSREDRMTIMQSNYKSNYFLIAKAENGYRIKKSPGFKNTYQIKVDYFFKNVPELVFQPCDYFMKKNNTIRVILKSYAIP